MNVEDVDDEEVVVGIVVPSGVVRDAQDVQDVPQVVGVTCVEGLEEVVVVVEVESSGVDGSTRFFLADDFGMLMEYTDFLAPQPVLIPLDLSVPVEVVVVVRQPAELGHLPRFSARLTRSSSAHPADSWLSVLSVEPLSPVIVENIALFATDSSSMTMMSCQLARQ